MPSKVAMVAVLALAACTTSGPADRPPAGVRSCSEASLGSFTGRQADAGLGARVLRESGAAVLRWIPEGAAVTMDLRSDRVNVRLDRANRVVGVTCG